MTSPVLKHHSLKYDFNAPLHQFSRADETFIKLQKKFFRKGALLELKPAGFI